MALSVSVQGTSAMQTVTGAPPWEAFVKLPSLWRWAEADTVYVLSGVRCN